jgi:DNA-binding CsgD family transcriptional regulator
MPNHVRVLMVPEADRAEPARRARDRGAAARVAEEARIVLLSPDGLTGQQIAERAWCSEPTVVTWRRSTRWQGWPGWRTRRGRAAQDGADRGHHDGDPGRYGDLVT